MARLLLLALLAGCTGPADTGENGTDEATDTDVAELLGILVNPEDVTVPVGSAALLKATGLLANRSSVDLTDQVTWTSDADHVATIGNDLDHWGLVTPLSEGEAWMTAELDDVVSPPVRVRVTDAGVLAVTIHPEEVSLGVGERTQLSATGALSDGTTTDATTQVRWVTGDGAVATTERDGHVVGQAVGSTQVLAEWDGVTSDPVTIHVVNDAAADLRIAEVDGFISGGILLLSVTVENHGNATAEDFWLDVFLDPVVSPILGDIGDDFDWVSSHAAGAFVQHDFEFNVSSGDHEVFIMVDTDDVVDEPDEYDNEWEGTFSPGATIGPDLTINYSDWLADDTHLLLEIAVTNIGDETSEEVFVEVYLDQPFAPQPLDIGDDFDIIEELAPFETVYTEWLIETVCDPCTTWFLVDSLDDLDEFDEANNVAGPITVQSEIARDTGWW